MNALVRSQPRCVGCGKPQGHPHARSCAFARFTCGAILSASFNYSKE